MNVYHKRSAGAWSGRDTPSGSWTAKCPIRHHRYSRYDKARAPLFRSSTAGNLPSTARTGKWEDPHNQGASNFTRKTQQSYSAVFNPKACATYGWWSSSGWRFRSGVTPEKGECRRGASDSVWRPTRLMRQSFSVRAASCCATIVCPSGVRCTMDGKCVSRPAPASF